MDKMPVHFMLTCHLISDNYTYWHLLLVQLVTLHWIVRIQCIRRTHVLYYYYMHCQHF